MRILFIDDAKQRAQQFREKNWTHDLVFAYSYPEALAALKNGPYDLICLDHDLAEEQYEKDCREASGTALAIWIAQNKAQFHKTTFFIHSLNHAGSKRMEGTLKDANLLVQITPWLWMKEVK